jgi:hypothetical protein
MEAQQDGRASLPTLMFRLKIYNRLNLVLESTLRSVGKIELWFVSAH